MSISPTELINPPIIESIVEIKFDSSLPNEAVFGVFYNLLKDEYRNIEQLNTANLPKEVIVDQPSLQFAPHYSLTSQDKPLHVLIGPKVITFKYQKYSNIEVIYPGWTKYIYNEIIKVLKFITASGYITKVIRVGLRSIDFFEDNIFENLRLKIEMVSRNLDNLPKSFRFTLDDENFNNTIAISSNSSLMKNNISTEGSTIDIDTSREDNVSTNIQDYLESIIQDGHNVNKELFFELLTEDYISQLESQ